MSSDRNRVKKPSVVNCQRCGFAVKNKPLGASRKWCATCRVIVRKERDRRRVRKA